MSLINTPLHQAIKRAFPQTNWPEKAIFELSKFKEGEPIVSSELSKDQLLIFVDLATAGLIESHRYPKFVADQFAGLTYVYKYRSNLDYTVKENETVDIWENQRKLSLVFGICVFLAIAAFFSTLTVLIIK